MSLDEIYVRGRKFSGDILCAFRENLRFDGPLIREDDYNYEGVKIVHNDKSLNLLEPYDTNNKLNHKVQATHQHKIVYTFNKYKYCGDLAQTHLAFSYNE